MLEQESYIYLGQPPSQSIVGDSEKEQGTQIYENFVGTYKKKISIMAVCMTNSFYPFFSLLCAIDNRDIGVLLFSIRLKRRKLCIDNGKEFEHRKSFGDAPDRNLNNISNP